MTGLQSGDYRFHHSFYAFHCSRSDVCFWHRFQF